MKRHLILSLALGLVGTMLLLLGLSSSNATAQEKRFDGVTLTVGTFGGVWRDMLQEMIGTKLEARGVKMQWVLGNPRDLLSRLVAARGQVIPFDVVEIHDTTFNDVRAGDFIQKLNHDLIPNLANMDPVMYDDYKVANWIVEEGIMYNPEKFAENGIPVPTKFKDLLHPKLKGRVSFPDIQVNTAVNGITGFAIDAGNDEGNIDGGLALIKKMQVNSYWTRGTEFTQQMKATDIWAVVAHAGWGIQMAKAGVPVKMVHPRIKDRKGMASLGSVGITKGSKAYEAAHVYIDALISEPVQTQLLIRNAIVPVNSKSQAANIDNPDLKPWMLLTPDEISSMYYVDFSKVDVKSWTRKWNRMVAQ